VANPGGRVGIHLELDLEDALAAHLDVVQGRALLLERRHHGRIHGFRVRGDGHFETEGGELAAHGIEIGLQAETAIRGQQREVQILREPRQAVEDAQASAAVESGLVEKAAALQAGQRDFLHDLAQGVLALLRGVTCQHLLDDAH
jgi:hypothetical protein